jgi:regulator of protease activity HflC (stomatin/prohibitin superfamily)
MSDKVIDIATQYGSLTTLENRITSISIEKSKAVLSSHKAMDIIANRATISPEVENAIKDAIGEEYFVSVTTVVLTNIDFSDSFEAAVEEKMIAEQTKLKADYENQTKIAKAEADAEAKLKAAQAEIEIAKAEAEAKMIAAEAEAKANETIAQSLTPEIMDKILADKWNGELPKVVGEGGYMLPSDIIS